MNDCHRFGLDSAHAGGEKGGPSLRPDLRVLSGLGRTGISRWAIVLSHFLFLKFSDFLFSWKAE
jgi:hypothetical protein